MVDRAGGAARHGGRGVSERAGSTVNRPRDAALLFGAPCLMLLIIISEAGNKNGRGAQLATLGSLMFSILSLCQPAEL